MKIDEQIRKLWAIECAKHWWNGMPAFCLFAYVLKFQKKIKINSKDLIYGNIFIVSI